MAWNETTKMKILVSKTMISTYQGPKFGKISIPIFLIQNYSNDKGIGMIIPGNCRHHLSHLHQIRISFRTRQAAACHNQQAHQHLQQHAICSHQHLWRVTWHPHLRRLFGMHAKSSCTSQLLQKSSSFFFEQCQWDKKPNQHQLWFPIPKGN